MDKAKPHYRIELLTDVSLRWYASIVTYYLESSSWSSEYTRTAETWQEALALAQQRIEERRRKR